MTIYTILGWNVEEGQHIEYIATFATFEGAKQYIQEQCDQFKDTPVHAEIEEYTLYPQVEYRHSLAYYRVICHNIHPDTGEILPNSESTWLDCAIIEDTLKD